MKLSPLRQREIRYLARTQLKAANALTLPIDPIAFAEGKNIIVQSFSADQKDISGFLMQRGNSFGIGYSTHIESNGFQRFTVAHELGHYLIDGHVQAVLSGGVHFSKVGYISIDKYEREADLFATEFLMPWILIEPIVQGAEKGVDAIRQIAKQCQSSLLASAIRFTEVTKECVAVVLSKAGTVDYMVASDSFKQIPGINWLRKTENIPTGTLSSDKSSDEQWIGSASFDSEQIDLRAWYPEIPKIHAEESVIGMGNYGRLLTLLVASYDPEDPDDDDDHSSDTYIDRWKSGVFRR